MLHITSRRFVARTQPRAEVKAYTNGGPATLFLNGVAVSTIAPIDHILRWNIQLAPGENRIIVASGSGTPALRDSVVWRLASKPSTVGSDQ